jgi:hypothetical protein
MEGGHMGKDDLCWKCQEYLKNLGLDLNKLNPDNHCHHEPKEKPKCWCETHEISSFVFVNDNALEMTAKLKSVKLNTKFCPECGKKLVES